MNEITFTQAAIDQASYIVANDMIPSETVAIRVFVSGGGCSGFQYGFKPAGRNEIADDDVLYDYDTVKFVVDPLSMMYLDGATVDFKFDVMSQQFTITNPNATSQCGCGHSFSA